MQRNEQVSEFKEKLVAVNRVSKTVKGGRNMRFSALMVVGDENGRIGCGMGKATEIPEAIRKGNEDAKKNMIKVSLKDTTIPHEVIGVYGTGKVLLMPAPEGTGLIAGGPVRQVLEAAGIRNIRTKSIGSNNPINMVKATMEGLKQLRSAEEIAKLRGKTVEELLGEGGREVMKLKITQTKSTIACLKDQIATIKALGLHKIGQTVVKQDNPAMRGMIFKVKHMVKVEEIED